MTYDTVIVGSHVVLPTGIIDKNLVLDDGISFVKPIILPSSKTRFLSIIPVGRTTCEPTITVSHVI